MSSPAKRYEYTYEDYLLIERDAATKHTFFNGEIFAMAGGSPKHARLITNLIVLLGQSLRGKPCRVYSSDLRLYVPESNLGTYPDVSVICGPLVHHPTDREAATNPTVVIEVLSASTQNYDCGEKGEHYQRMRSLQSYVLVAQDTIDIEVWNRDHNDSWRNIRVSSADDTLELPAIDCRISLADIYLD